MKQLHLRIVGLTRGGCAQCVEKALRGVSGVSGAVVNLINESASVATAGNGLSTSDLLSAARKAGCHAAVMADSMSSDLWPGDWASGVGKLPLLAKAVVLVLDALPPDQVWMRAYGGGEVVNWDEILLTLGKNCCRVGIQSVGGGLGH